MHGFTLPSNSIPPWAGEISDDQWRNLIDCKVKCEKRDENTAESNENLH